VKLFKSGSSRESSTWDKIREFYVAVSRDWEMQQWKGYGEGLPVISAQSFFLPRFIYISISSSPLYLSDLRLSRIPVLVSKRC
jgi:hypothetical protein